MRTILEIFVEIGKRLNRSRIKGSVRGIGSLWQKSIDMRIDRDRMQAGKDRKTKSLGVGGIFLFRTDLALP